MSALVKANETITTIVKDTSGNGKYTYKNEAGVEVVIDVPAAVVENFETIINNETVLHEIEQIVTQVGGGNVYYDGTTFKYTDAINTIWI